MADQPKHGEKDRVYKQLYSFAEVVEEVVVEIVGKSVGGDWVDDLDFGTLEPMPTEFVDAERETVRLVDMAWRVRFQDRPLWLVLLFEFQSKEDKRMATRALLETAMCYQSFAEGRGAGAEGEASAVLVVVVKSFEGRWRGSPSKASELEKLVPEELRPFIYGQRVVLLDEQAEAAKGASLDLRKAGRLRAGLALGYEEDPERVAQAFAVLERLAAPALREAYLAWIRVQMIDWKGSGKTVEQLKTLKEAAKVYTNQFARVAKAAQARGQKLGEARGQRIGEARGQKLGEARGQELGEARGQKLGEARGLRRAYVETAKWKFGADVAERLADVLAGVTDRSRLARMGRLLAECETGDELIAKAGGD